MNRIDVLASTCTVLGSRFTKFKPNFRLLAGRSTSECNVQLFVLCLQVELPVVIASSTSHLVVHVYVPQTVQDLNSMCPQYFRKNLHTMNLRINVLLNWNVRNTYALHRSTVL